MRASTHARTHARTDTTHFVSQPSPSHSRDLFLTHAFFFTHVAHTQGMQLIHHIKHVHTCTAPRLAILSVISGSIALAAAEFKFAAEGAQPLAAPPFRSSITGTPHNERSSVRPRGRGGQGRKERLQGTLVQGVPGGQGLGEGWGHTPFSPTGSWLSRSVVTVTFESRYNTPGRRLLSPTV